MDFIKPHCVQLGPYSPRRAVCKYSRMANFVQFNGLYLISFREPYVNAFRLPYTKHNMFHLFSIEICASKIREVNDITDFRLKNKLCTVYRQLQVKLIST